MHQFYVLIDSSEQNGKQLGLECCFSENVSLNNEIKIQTHFLFEIKVLMSFGLVDIDIFSAGKSIFFSIQTFKSKLQRIFV